MTQYEDRKLGEGDRLYKPSDKLYLIHLIFATGDTFQPSVEEFPDG
ncbi:MAG: hypothetical protein KME38_15785 [Spirirestis rafaelensis WJT71-NPBG6]|nr:hypothetical protein [Spirirestis rafaelensis WJT71-NPBG6]